MNGPLEWFKSSYSSEQGGNCLEIATCPAVVHIRDSKNPDGPMLTLAPDAWSAFTAFAAAQAPR